MSYILEALKKADRERNLGDVPDLESAHWGERRTPGTSRWPWIVAALLLFNAGLLVYLLGREEPEVAGQTGAVNISLSGVQGGTGQPASEPLQRLPKPVREKPREMRQKVKTPPPAVAPAQQARAVARPSTQPRVVESSTPLSGGDSESQVPEWGELPLSFRSGFALPRIDVHVFADEPARRFVLIELKKYREGDTLDSGAVLERIAPGSIQLFYQGTRFRVDR